MGIKLTTEQLFCVQGPGFNPTLHREKKREEGVKGDGRNESSEGREIDNASLCIQAVAIAVCLRRPDAVL